jgi:hypothetical protein
MFCFPVKCARCLYLLRVLSSRWLRKEPLSNWQAEEGPSAMEAEGKVCSHHCSLCTGATPAGSGHQPRTGEGVPVHGTSQRTCLRMCLDTARRGCRMARERQDHLDSAALGSCPCDCRPVAPHPGSAKGSGCPRSSRAVRPSRTRPPQPSQEPGQLGFMPGVGGNWFARVRCVPV